MKLHYLRDEALSTLRLNIEMNKFNYLSPNNSWIYKQIENPFGEYNVEVNEIDLNSNLFINGVSEGDLECSKRLYLSLKNITPIQATDERLWSGLAHGDLYEFCRFRILNNGQLKNFKTDRLNNHFFLNSKLGFKRKLIVNNLSRYWWISYLTYDSSKSDPFEYTNYFKENFSTKALVFFSNNFMNNPYITHGLIDALIKLEEIGVSIGEQKRDLYIQSIQYLNLLGGSSVLDYFTSEEISQKVFNFIYANRNR